MQTLRIHTARLLSTFPGTIMVPRVGIIGGGLCGPAMAIFLKTKGYDPVIYERTTSIKDRGLATGCVVLFALACLVFS